MHKQMLGLLPLGGKGHLTEIYGYSSKGVPGLEIVGLGAKGKAIKEKFVFLSKKYNLKISPKRYVLCIDDNMVLGSLTSKDELYRWLELPLLILYWSMAGVLPIQNLRDCLCAGRISTRGKIEPFRFDETSAAFLDRLDSMRLKVITSYTQELSGLTYFIPLDEIIRFPDAS